MLNYARPVVDADCSLTLSREALNDVILAQATAQEKVEAGEVKVHGDPKRLQELLSLLDDF